MERTMDTKDLWQRLEAFGLDENEARLYFHLSQVGAQRASELAERTGIHRTEVYRVAKGLVGKGFAERTLERPVRFAPRSLRDVLATHTERAAREVEGLRQSSARLLEDWPERAQEWDPVSTRFVVHQGLPQVRSLLERMLRQATQDVVLVVSPPTLRRIGLPTLLAAIPVEERPVVRVLVSAAGEDAAVVESLEATCQVRQLETPTHLEMVVLDDREVALVVAASRPPRQEETLLWLNAHEFVSGQRALAERLWAQAIDLAEVRRARLERRRARQAEVVRGPWVFLSRLKALLHDADGAIVHCTHAELDAWRGRGLWQVVEARRRAGADIRFLVSESPDIAKPWPDGVLPSLEPWPVTVAATDGGEVLAARPSHDVWGIQAALPEVGMWAWHLLQGKWDEALLKEGVSH